MFRVSLSLLVLLVLGSVGCSNSAKETGKDSPAPEPTPARTDWDHIQGTWIPTEAEHEGKKIDERAPEDVIIFSGKRLIVKRNNGYTHPGTFTIDPSKTPKTIDLGWSEKNPKRLNLGVYELDGDTLRICFGDEGAPRPTTFESKAGSKTRIVTLKRDKNAPEFKEPDGAGYAEAIVGRWRLSNGATEFAIFFGETEFTKDGRVLKLEPGSKEWVEKYKYRFEKAELVVVFPKTGGKDRPDWRAQIGSITADELIAVGPTGKLTRLK